MTVTTTANKTILLGNGSTTVFSFGFIVPALTDLQVYYTNLVGVTTLLDQSLYTVSGLGNATGGTVTYPIIGSAIPSGTTLTILRENPLTQEFEIGDQQNFNASAIEGAFDNTVMQIQDLNEVLQRTPSLSVFSTATTPIFADPVAGAVLQYSADGTQIISGSTVSGGGSGSISNISNYGFTDFVISTLTVPSVPVTGLSVALPGGQALIANTPLTFAAFTATVNDNSVTDYWLNSDGTFTIVTEPLDNYTALPHYTGLLHIWGIQSQSGNIVAIDMRANTSPQPIETTDYARVIDQAVELYALGSSYTNWSEGLTVTYKELLLTNTGNVYQVFTPGVTGSVQPTSTAVGEITDGSAVLFYYSQSCFGGNFRYAVNNGINNYFTNIGVGNLCAMTLQSGTMMSTYAGPYITNQFYHLIINWQASSAYGFGQKVIEDGFIWINTVGGSSTTASSNAAFVSARPHSVGQVVTDGSVIWQAIHASYGSQNYFWMDCDRTMKVYSPPDSNDSYASTFLALISKYTLNGGGVAWLTTSSPQPDPDIPTMH